MTIHPLAALACTALVACGASRDSLASLPYRAAMYDAVAGVSQELRIFPFQGSAFSIPLPFPLASYTYDASGKMLFASDLRDAIASVGDSQRPAIFKIEFDPTRVSPVDGSEGFGVASLAANSRAGKLIISGSRGGTCGIFEVDLRMGSVRSVIPTSCGGTLLSYWEDLKLSPDGTRAVGLRNHHLELIDLVHGNAAALSADLTYGAWSPDGRWFAGMTDGGKTVLMDGRTLKQERIVGDTDLIIWSPDSRFLLAQHRPLYCGPYASTLEVVNIETAKRTVIASSRCQVGRGTIGWVSGDIRR